MTRKLLVAAVAALIMGWPRHAPADQLDKRLDALFGKLKSAAPADAQTVEKTIWKIWAETADIDARFPFARGLEAMGEENYREALDFFTETTRRAPNFAEAWNKRATVAYLMGDYAQSVSDIERTLALEPRHFGALSGLGLINLALDRDAQALKAFEAALAVNPHMPAVQARVKELKEKLKGKST